MVVTLTPAVVGSSECMVDVDGIWLCQVGPVAASFQEYTLTAVSNDQTIALNNVLFGDVWVWYYRRHVIISVFSPSILTTWSLLFMPPYHYFILTIIMNDSRIIGSDAVVFLPNLLILLYLTTLHQLCSGQSNMEFTVDSAFNATAEVAAAANFPYIRLFSAALVASSTPLNQLGVSCSFGVLRHHPM